MVLCNLLFLYFQSAPEFKNNGLVNGLPLVVFAYMYQPNIPLIYKELERKSYRRMDKVVLRGSSGAIFLYNF
jgi:amino acid permease